MAIACLGWGSLIWNPGALPRSSEWRTDGPSIPVEFARRSKDGRVTLVIVETSAPSSVLWCDLAATGLERAIKDLADREGCNANAIGRWPGDGGYAFSQEIEEWAYNKGLDGVVWTALPPKWDKPHDLPSLDAVTHYLGSLDGAARRRAAEYIRRAPAQINTPYRPALEAVFAHDT